MNCAEFKVDKMLKIKIIKMTDPLDWYKNNIGDECEVLDYKNYFRYKIKNDTRYIMKEDCIILEED